MGKPAKKLQPSEAPASTPPPPAPAAPGLPVIGPEGKPSLARALTPRILLDSTPAEWLFKLPIERRHLILLTAFAALIFFPYLGAVGFWDPWEPHYGEVAREMIVRQDYVHPFWECAYFFSKPILPLWMMAIGMLISGANDPAAGISVSTEWWVRSMIALVAIGGVLFTYLGVARTIGRRTAIWSAVILATMPFYFLLARQAMVDMPFVGINTAAIACFMIAVFEKEHVQDGWLYAFYALAGVACLAKGLLGIALPGAAVLGYLVLSGDWKLLLRLRLITGPIVTMLMFMPWYTVMSYFPGKDDESSNWFDRFIIHDHFARMGEGVHTTTPNTTFVYFIEQLGFGLFPWVAGIPGALLTFFSRPKLDKETRKHRAKLFVIAWAVTTFTFFSLSMTKFHHYIFPAVPAIAILIALWIEQVLEDGVGKHALAWVAGAVLFALVGRNLFMEPKHLVDLFVYNYERPYPSREVDPHQAFLALFLLGPAAALFGVPAIRSWFVKLWNWKPVLPKEHRSAILGGVGVYAVGFLTFAQMLALYLCKASRFWGYRPLPWFQDIVERWPVWQQLGATLGLAIVATVLVGLLAAIPLTGFWHNKFELGPQYEDENDRLFVVGAIALLAFGFAFYVSAVHWRRLTYHWTQRDLFWTYYHERLPSEPIGAYQMNWRGETFYSRNTVRQLKEPGELRDFAAIPGREWVLVEHSRLNAMKGVLSPQYRVREIEKNFTDKFTLAVIEDNQQAGTGVRPATFHAPTVEAPVEKYEPNHIH